jgi:uncharacterized protein
MSPSRFRRRLAGAAAVAVVLAGCAPSIHYPSRPGPGTLSPESPLRSGTLAESDAWLRHWLMEGREDSAAHMLTRPRRGGPRDALLRDLQLAIVHHQAGRWRESDAALDAAETEAENRFTRSVSRAAASLVANDAAIEYVPPPAEMAMVPYYRMLNRLAVGDGSGARVEARKATAYLERIRDAVGSGEPCIGEGVVQYVAGLVFAAGGEHNDALVSFRQAERAYDACGMDAGAAPPELGLHLYRAALRTGAGDLADAAVERYGLSPEADARGGEVLVLVEHGWVAHRAHRDVHVPILGDELRELREDGGAVDLAARVTARLFGNLAEQAYWGDTWDAQPVNQLAVALDGGYVLKMAWPVYRLEACAAPAVRVTAGGESWVEGPIAGDLSAAVVRRWEAQRTAAFARMVARSLGRFVLTDQAERAAEKENEVLGYLVGRVANAAGNAMERADTRSWSLLPDRISVARLALDPGEHRVSVEVLGEGGAGVATLDLGTVTVAAGETVILNGRVWGGEMGDLARRLPGGGPALTSSAVPAN